MNGARYLSELLESRGVRHVFGLPGSQNAILFSELRRSSIKPVVTTNEMSAGFAALGYGATTTAPGFMAIIGGPGFMFALTALQEAKLDSVPIVCMVFVRSGDTSKSYRLQQTDYPSVAATICKEVIEVGDVSELNTGIHQAARASHNSGPGPVLLVVESQVLEANVNKPMLHVAEDSPVDLSSIEAISTASIDRLKRFTELSERLISELRGKRVLMLLGRGTMQYSREFTELTDKLGAALLTSTSGRGVVAENHERVIQSDLVSCSVVNEFIATFDRVLAVGIRFSENGSRGYQLDFKTDQLIHFDSDPEILGVNLPTSQAQCISAAEVARLLEKAADFETTKVELTELDKWRQQFRDSIDAAMEPRIQGLETATPASFFQELRDILPDDAILTTDSGSHQMLARKYYEVRSANGLLVPTNFQSMGFAISTAIGAQHAHPHRKVVALVGDGGLQMSGLQLLSAVRDRQDLTVIVFSDGYFGHIRKQQLDYDGEEAGVVLPALDLAAFSDSIGASFFDGSENLPTALRSAISSTGTSIVEVLLDDAEAVRHQRTKSRIKRVAKDVLGDSFVQKLKNLRPS